MSDLAQQLIRSEITTEEFNSLFNQQSPDDRSQIISDLLDGFSESPTLNVQKALASISANVLEGYRQGDLSPSAEGVVESLFEQLRISGHVSPSRRYKIDGQDLRQLALDVNIEPNITRVVTNSSGEKTQEILDTQYIHEYIEISDQNLAPNTVEQLTQLQQELAQWSSRSHPPLSEIFKYLNSYLSDILEGGIIGSVWGFVASRDTEGRLAAIGSYSYIPETGEAQLNFNLGSPESRLSAAIRPEGTLLNANTANRIALLRHLADQYPDLTTVITQAGSRQATQQTLDLYFLPQETSLEEVLFTQQSLEGYGTAQDSLLHRKLTYLSHISEDLETAANVNSDRFQPELLTAIGDLNARIIELESNPTHELTHELVEQFRVDLGQQIRQFETQSSQNLTVTLSHEANRLAQKTMSLILRLKRNPLSRLSQH